MDQIRVNANGTMVSCLCTSVEASREPHMFVYCSDCPTPLHFDFSKDGKLPQVMAWDFDEPKLLAVQTMVRGGRREGGVRGGRRARGLSCQGGARRGEEGC